MTYIWTWEGWLFLAAIVDVFSRRVVGWTMADHLGTELPESFFATLKHRRHSSLGYVSPMDFAVFGRHASGATTESECLTGGAVPR
jgi:putative transposase